MAETLPTQFNDLAALEEISPRNWRALCDEVQYPEGATSKNICGALLHDLMAKGVEFSPELIESLEHIHQLGTVDGSELLQQLAQGLAVKIPIIANEGPRDFAARLCAARMQDTNIQKLLDYAQAAAIGKGPSRTYREFAGREAAPVVRPTQFCAPLQAAIGAWCGETGRSPHCRVRVYEHGDELQFYVTHGHCLESPSVLKGDKHEVIKFRRVQSDFIRYNLGTGRLWVTCASVQLVHVLRAIFGTILFGDPEFFAATAALSLDVLQVEGRAALDRHHVNQIATVRLVKATLRLADGSSFTARAGPKGDCFGGMDAQRVSLAVGQITHATLKITLNGKRGARTVHLELPDKFSMAQDETAPLICTFLEQVGIRHVPPPRPDDLWAMGTGAQSTDEWRAALGQRDFDKLRTERALFAAQRIVVPTVGGEVVEVREVEGFGGHVGVSMNDDLEHARPLSASEVEGFALHLPTYAALLARELGLTGSIVTYESEGLVALGERQLGQKVLRVFLLARAVATPQLVGVRLDSERRAGRDAIVLVPRGRQPSTGATEVAFSWRGFDARELVRSIILELGWQNELPANLVAPASADLVVDEGREKVWIKDVELPIVPDTHPYKYIVTLARHRGAAVSNAEMERILSPAGTDEAVVRKAKSDLKDLVEEGFESAGLPKPDFEAMFPKGRGQSRTTLEAFIGGELVIENSAEPATVA